MPTLFFTGYLPSNTVYNTIARQSRNLCLLSKDYFYKELTLGYFSLLYAHIQYSIRVQRQAQIYDGSVSNFTKVAKKILTYYSNKLPKQFEPFAIRAESTYLIKLSLKKNIHRVGMSF